MIEVVVVSSRIANARHRVANPRHRVIEIEKVEYLRKNLQNFVFKNSKEIVSIDSSKRYIYQNLDFKQ